VRVLFAAAEIYPLLKTGGLADVAAALPGALHKQGVEIRLVMPAYRGVIEQLQQSEVVGELRIREQPVRLLAGNHPETGVPIILVDIPGLFDRDGGPYIDAAGFNFGDNAWRFATFCEAVAQIAIGAAGDALAADIVHLNDWHTGLVPLYLPKVANRPRCVFTIHNLAYQGIFDRWTFDLLGLAESLWHPDALEVCGNFSFLKAGLLYADVLTAVSPSYAREIQTAELGEGLDDLLRARSPNLTGILNGIDDLIWNPAKDSLLDYSFDARKLKAGKLANKRALQRRMGLKKSDAPILAMISRLAYQKGADALLAAVAELSLMRLQIVILASGDRYLEDKFAAWAAHKPSQIAVSKYYTEELAHLIEAGADMLIMPSRYEPCGLNQMYSQRYGTIPLVRRIGGLADSVDGLDSCQPTGIHFENTDPQGVLFAVRKGCELYLQPKLWRKMQVAGMSRDWSWRKSAAEYLQIYAALGQPLNKSEAAA